MTRRNTAVLLVVVALSLLTPVVVGVVVSFLRESPKATALTMHSVADLVLDSRGQWALRTTEPTRAGVLAFGVQEYSTKCGLLEVRREWALLPGVITPESPLAAVPHADATVTAQLAYLSLVSIPQFRDRYPKDPRLSAGIASQQRYGFRILAGWFAEPLL